MLSKLARACHLVFDISFKLSAFFESRNVTNGYVSIKINKPHKCQMPKDYWRLRKA